MRLCDAAKATAPNCYLWQTNSQERIQDLLCVMSRSSSSPFKLTDTIIPSIFLSIRGVSRYKVSSLSDSPLEALAKVVYWTGCILLGYFWVIQMALVKLTVQSVEQMSMRQPTNTFLLVMVSQCCSRWQCKIGKSVFTLNSYLNSGSFMNCPAPQRSSKAKSPSKVETVMYVRLCDPEMTIS